MCGVVCGGAVVAGWLALTVSSGWPTTTVVIPPTVPATMSFTANTSEDGREDAEAVRRVGSPPGTEDTAVEAKSADGTPEEADERRDRKDGGGPADWRADTAVAGRETSDSGDMQGCDERRGEEGRVNGTAAGQTALLDCCYCRLIDRSSACVTCGPQRRARNTTSEWVLSC